MKHQFKFFGLLVLLAMILAACSPAAATEPAQVSQPTEAAAATEAAATEAGAAVPTSLKIVIVNPTEKEQPWNTALLQAMDRVVAAKPHGLDITYTFQEKVANSDGVRVMGELAASGEYGIIWAHDAYPDGLAALGPQYPDIAFVGAGSGYDPMGDNMYWVNMDLHEAAYLAGVLSAKMTKTNVLGAVAAYPYPNVNEPVNAFFEGAKSVNPAIVAKMNYISAWYDPAKAKEAALSEIAAGADVVYAERFGPFEAAKEKGVYSIGHMTDQSTLAPETVLTSPVVLWDPTINAIIDAWWEHTVNGTPYNAPTDKALVFSMKDGGCDLAPYGALDSVIPQDVKDLVAKTREDIISGKLVIKANAEEVKGE
ncbi:MAG: BMP family protein [Anaerolineaceae bacterium]